MQDLCLLPLGKRFLYQRTVSRLYLLRLVAIICGRGGCSPWVIWLKGVAYDVALGLLSESQWIAHHTVTSIVWFSYIGRVIIWRLPCVLLFVRIHMIRLEIIYGPELSRALLRVHTLGGMHVCLSSERTDWGSTKFKGFYAWLLLGRRKRLLYVSFG